MIPATKINYYSLSLRKLGKNISLFFRKKKKNHFSSHKVNIKINACLFRDLHIITIFHSGWKKTRNILYDHERKAENPLRAKNGEWAVKIYHRGRFGVFHPDILIYNQNFNLQFSYVCGQGYFNVHLYKLSVSVRIRSSFAMGTSTRT